MFSKTCQYGIKATIFIAQKSLNGQCVSLKAITKEIDSPTAFTAKILQKLAKSEIIESVKGAAGGYRIEKDKLKAIRLHQIIYAIDGDALYNSCGLGLQRCNAHKPCPVHHKFSVLRDSLKEMFMSTRIFELATGLENGLTYLKR